MAAQRNTRRALAWQAALICLPIALLAGLGIFYLRQERILVRHEAEERARILAGELSDRFWRDLTNSAALSQEHAFRIDGGGALLFPVPYEKAPAPHPLDLERLAPEHAQAWSNPRPEPAALRQLLETELPLEFQAMASYRMGLVLEGQNKIAEAAAMFRLAYEKFPESVGETGLPLAPLAGLKAVELASPAGTTGPLTWDVLCRDAIARPSVLTSLIIERAARAGVVPANRIAAYREEWQTDETLRELYRASRQQLSSASAPPPVFWIHNAGDRWLVSRVEEHATNLWLVCRKIVVTTLPAKPRGDVAGPKIDRADETRAMRVSIGAKPPLDPNGRIQILPEHLAPGLVVANEAVIPAPNAPVLATAVHTENGREWLRVSLHLISPELLYARQGQRVLWFGGLIAASSLAAGIGLISAWRNFEKQHRLAELKDNFVSSVSHELRAPIASVRLMAEGLERGRVQDPHKQQEYYHFIVQECQRLSALIQNVLDFSRIDQGRKEYEFESADVLRLVDETVKAMGLCAAERQIRLRFAPNPSPINAVIDARAIQQALVNLIDNAIKHSSPGSEVTITAATPNTTVVPTLQLSVEDHGEGIPKAEHERIFERFYRIGSELRRQTPGAGIGLSIVKHVVEAHGGRVRVESNPGQGSRFTIQIPLKG
jgi:signal transduction histidine kinase